MAESFSPHLQESSLGSSSSSSGSGVGASVGGVNGMGAKADVVEPVQLSGFARGMKAESILGATEMSGQILFLIKW